MKYVVLLRGINVGGNRKVPMADLRAVFEGMGFADVVTYINSGNVVFSAQTAPVASAIKARLEKAFGFDIDTLVLSQAEVVSVAKAIPDEWLNDAEQKSDVLYLFADIDSSDIMSSIGFRPEFETIHYVPGALITNVSRKYQSKSSLLKLVGTPLYRRMTIRNVTTARKLAELVQ
ncbi:DUF1697 domain-containing protein [Candidatus Saccharibacteria bacterium]|nr:MAG: DUF1697 domain-containing protein [Candidatus Saccharibacteria bacterium]